MELFKNFGTVWMKEAGLTREEFDKGNRLKIFGLTFIYSMLLILMTRILVIHQMGPLDMIGGPNMIAKAKPSYGAFLPDYGRAFRTCKHGPLQGFIAGIFIALSIILING